MKKLAIGLAVGVSLLGALTATVNVAPVHYAVIAVAAGGGWWLGRKAARSPIVRGAFDKAQKADLPPELASLTSNETRSGLRGMFTSIRSLAGYMWIHHRSGSLVAFGVVSGWIVMQLLPGLVIAGARGTLSIFLFTMVAIALVDLMLADRP